MSLSTSKRMIVSVSGHESLSTTWSESESESVQARVEGLGVSECTEIYLVHTHHTIGNDNKNVHKKAIPYSNP